MEFKPVVGGRFNLHYFLLDLLLSPSARGYFHKAISQSGSALNPWAYQTNPRDVAFQLARDLGLSENLSNAELIAILRQLPPMSLVDATPGSMDYVSSPQWIYTWPE